MRAEENPIDSVPWTYIIIACVLVVLIILISVAAGHLVGKCCRLKPRQVRVSFLYNVTDTAKLRQHKQASNQ